jgi:hypothetical protein
VTELRLEAVFDVPSQRWEGIFVCVERRRQRRDLDPAAQLDHCWPRIKMAHGHPRSG